MTLFYEEGSETTVITSTQLKSIIGQILVSLGEKNKVLLLPPDYTRFNSRAGEICQIAYQHYGNKVSDIMPTLGTHTPVTNEQQHRMFTGIPTGLFRVHDWRNDVVKVGEVPAKMVREASAGGLDRPWPVQVNRLLWEGGHDLILSVGQVVPHEVMGMANYNKNILIGCGGSEAINLSHFIGACYGMERMMGRADNPLRRILNHASREFLDHLPIVYILTVIGREPSGELAIRGLFAGDDEACFERAAALSLRVNFELLPRPLERVVAYMDPEEFRTTWLANKAIYRTRMALADGARLVVLAPGVRRFGEDAENDRIIRQVGYRSTPRLMARLRREPALRAHLGALSHLVHGSPEGRFEVVYCPGPALGRAEIEGVGYTYGDLDEMMKKYPIKELKDGFNTLLDGEEIFFISNPALGLWAYEKRFFPDDSSDQIKKQQKGWQGKTGDSETKKGAKMGGEEDDEIGRVRLLSVAVDDFSTDDPLLGGSTQQQVVFDDAFYMFMFLFLLVVAVLCTMSFGLLKLLPNDDDSGSGNDL